MIELLADPATWASLATLTLMEVVLGIDNIVFISILAAKLPESQRDRARIVGLSIAAATRLLLLLAISWMIGLTETLVELFDHPFTGRDLILLGGGIFLVYKATREIHEKLEGEEVGEGVSAKATFASVITQIVMLDIIFSLDSVITAVGMTDSIAVMMTAVIIALAVMVWLGKRISDFVMQHPTVKMLALAFLLLIGVSLAAEAFHSTIPKGYIYSAMAFSVFVEMLNLFAKKRKERKSGKKPIPVHLRKNVVGLKVTGDSSDSKGYIV